MSKSFCTLLMLVMLLSCIANIADAQRNSAQHCRSPNCRRQTHPSKPQGRNQDFQGLNKSNQLRDQPENKNATTSNVRRLIENLDNKSEFDVQTSRVAYVTNDGRTRAHRNSHVAGDWTDHSSKRDDEGPIIHVPVDSHADSEAKSEENQSETSHKVVIQEGNLDLYSHSNEEDSARENSREIILERVSDIKRNEHAPNQHHPTDQYVVRPAIQYVTERYASEDEPQGHSNSAAAHESVQNHHEHRGVADHMRRVIVEELPNQRTSRVVIGEPLPPLKRKIIVEEPNKVHENDAVDEPVKIITEEGSRNTAAGRRHSQHMRHPSNAQGNGSEATYIHDIDIAGSGSNSDATLGPAPIQFAQDAEAGLKNTGGFLWWLIPIIIFGLISIGILLWCILSKDKEEQSEEQIVARQNDEKEIDAEITRQLDQRRRSRGSSGVVKASAQEELKAAVKQEGVTSSVNAATSNVGTTKAAANNEDTSKVGASEVQNAGAKADAPPSDGKGTSKKITMVRRRGKIVAEKHEILDENGKVIKTHIQKITEDGS
ncbi:unnamed protein product [Moneuplotes crassus]|uniref:Uncharacterized protein n=1 Tax=Euplotes crassus TaxID=5936 RepID=A0AAD1UFV4_EUPCR|nr:unnamed protein product [Moneuplotes crassus]